MAERRMILKSIMYSDSFLEISSVGQNLYIYICISADDDGFVDNARMISRIVGATEKDLYELCEKGYLIGFDSGIFVVTHWCRHNRVRKDTYRETAYQEEKNMLYLDENYVYRLKTEEKMSNPVENEPLHNCNEPLRNCNEPSTQDSIGKDRIGKVSLRERGEGENSQPAEESAVSTAQTEKERHGNYGNVLLTPKEYLRLGELYPEERDALIEKLSEYMEISGKSYKNHYALLRKWAKEDLAKNSEDGSLKVKDSFDIDEFFALSLAASRKKLNDIGSAKAEGSNDFQGIR